MAEQGGPHIEIVEQPQSKGFRFRYACEGKSHGGIQGTTSRKDKKTYPTVKLRNCSGLAKVVVSLVTDEDVPRPHVHELVGKNCENGVCTVVIKADESAVSFPNLGIKHVTKKDVFPVLRERLRELRKSRKAMLTMDLDPSTVLLTDEEEDAIRREAVDLSKEMHLNVVRIQFSAYLLDEQKKPALILAPVHSCPIYDNKASSSSTLKICRMDKVGGCCTGGEEVFLLCDKIQKEDVAVRFYEQDEEGLLRWEEFAQFSPHDVHRQCAIVFRTPPYLCTNIANPKTVHVQLTRISDGEASDPKTFIYYPQEIGMNGIQNKRKRQFGYYGDGFQHPVHTDRTNGTQGIRAVRDDPSVGNTDHHSFLLLGRGRRSGNSGPRIETDDDSQSTAKKELRWLEKLEQLSECLRLYSSTEDVRFLVSPLKALIKNQNEDGDNSVHLSVIHNKAMAAFNLLSVLNSSTRKHLAVDQTNDLNQTPVLLSMVANEPVHLKMLLEAGCNVEQLTAEGDTLLHVASKLDRYECMELLFAHIPDGTRGILDRFNYDGFTAVHEASRRGNLNCLKLLVKQSANVQLKDQISGKTALHHAVDGNHLAVVAFLILETQIDVNSTTLGGITALHTAVSTKQLKTTALLVSANADLGAPDDSFYPSDEESSNEQDDGETADRVRPTTDDLEERFGSLSLTEEMRKLLSGEPYENVIREASYLTNTRTGSLFCDSGIESLKKE